MAAPDIAELYHQRATEMRAQVERPETVYLKAFYAVIAENWEQLADQMDAATHQTLSPAPNRSQTLEAALPERAMTS